MAKETYSSVHGKDEHHEEEREVSRAVVVCEHEDEAAHEHNRYRVQEKPEAVPNSVAQERVTEGPENDEHVWRGCEKEVDHVGFVVEGFLCQCREEVLETVRNDQRSILSVFRPL